MTEIEFNHCIGKLKSYYGDKFFHPDRVKVVAKKLRLLTGDDFERLCEDLIANMNMAPTLKDFLKIGEAMLHARQQEKYQSDKKLLEADPPCSSCDGDGYLTATKELMGRIYPFAFRCSDFGCLAAKLFVDPNYIKWSSAFEPEYQLRKPWQM